MAQTAIHTRTESVGTAYVLLGARPRSVLTVYAVSQDIHLVCGTEGIENASDANAFLLPAGAALEMKPAPKGEIYVRSAAAGGQISYWYS